MIDFSNKYLTLLAVCILFYWFFNSASNFKEVSKRTSASDGKTAVHHIVIDPHKKKENYTLMEKFALMNLPEDALNKFNDAKGEILSPKDLKIQNGDKVFVEIDFINSKTEEHTKAFSVKIGEDDKIEKFVVDNLIGMKMEEEKVVENPEDKDDIREIKVLYIERKKQI